MVHTLSLVPRHKLRHAKRAHFYIRFDVCASASRTDIKKLSAHNVCTQRSLWSEWRDLNSRPYGPEPYALPNCATPRYYKFAFTSTVASLGARRAFPLGLAFFTVDLKSYLFLVFRSFCFRSYRKPNCAHPDNILQNRFNKSDCLCNIQQLAHFCNKNKAFISKFIVCDIIFYLRLTKSIAKR